MLKKVAQLQKLAHAIQLACGAVVFVSFQAIAGGVPVNALPTGGAVQAGQAAINQSANTLNVNQSSQKAVIAWDSFSVGREAKVNFNQPNANASTLNIVNGSSKSMINGAVNANGHVVFVNQNGVVFGKHAEVHVGGMVATTMNVDANAYMNGDGAQTYKGNGTGKVVNKGKITVNSASGYIALMAPEVVNEGVISATLSGSNAVALVSGQQVTLNLKGQQLLSISVDASAVKSLISNKRLIQVEDGSILIAANAVQDLKNSVVQNTGTLSATGISKSGGKISLRGSNVIQNGTVAANSEAAMGGTVTITGNHVTLESGSITAATGATGGGQVLLGTPVAMPLSDTVVSKTVDIKTGAVVDASATQSGHGGTVSVWSSVSTTVAGTLNAKGGAISGDGGHIETSSYGRVTYDKGLVVNTTAPNGKTGVWTTDPLIISVDASAASMLSQALASTNVVLNATVPTCSGLGACAQSATPVINFLQGADVYSSNPATSLTLNAIGGTINVNSHVAAGQVYAVAQEINVRGSINSTGGSSGQVYLAGAALNILGSVGSNGSNSGSNSGSNTSGSSGNAGAGSSGNRRRSSSDALKSDTNTYTSNGGTVNLMATGDITIGSANHSTASVSANGLSGGTVNVISLNGNIHQYGVVDAMGLNGQGGKITVAAAQNNNFVGALMAVDGLSQGGVFQIGIANGVGTGSTLAPPAISDQVATLLAAINFSPTANSTFVSNQTALDSATLITANAQASNSLQAPNFSKAGSIYLVGNSSLDTAATLTANADNGGLILLSSPAGIYQNTGYIQTNGGAGLGGTIAQTGLTSTTLTGATLQANGQLGGGQIVIGRDFKASPLAGSAEQAALLPTFSSVFAFPTSAFTVIDQASSLSANSIQGGHAGNILVWGNNLSAFGTFSAKALGSYGNGGLIETSGDQLSLTGISVNASTVAGSSGTWLLDPSDFTITQSVADSYRNTLNGGTNVLNDVAGAITWNSGVTLNKTAGGDATLTLRTIGGNQRSNISLNGATISSSSGKLNLVLWTGLNLSSGTVSLLNSSITTNGGHLWVGGGAATTWNGLDVGNGAASIWNANEQGVLVRNSSISTGAGNISMAGLSSVTDSNNGVRNIGLLIDSGSTLTTTSGNINLSGEVRGKYTNAWGLLVGSPFSAVVSGNISITSGSGAITLTGAGYDEAGSGTGYRLGTAIQSVVAGSNVTVRSSSGAITVVGTGAFGSAGDFTSNTTSGLQFQNDSTTGSVNVVSGSGNITLRGQSNLQTGAYQNGIRFLASDAANNIRIGYDGSTAYSGNILIESDSILQNASLGGAGSLSLQTTGNLTIAPQSASFTALRAGNTGTLTFDNDWNFGSNLGGFTLGKVGNTSSITLSNFLTVAGPVSIYGGDITLQNRLTAAGAITLKAVTTDVLLQDVVTNSAGNATTLTIEAARSIKLDTNASIAATNAAMSTQLVADTNADGDGIVYVTSSGIDTRGGSLTFGKIGQTATINGVSTMVGGDTYFQRGSAQTLSTGGGALNVYGETIVANTAGLTVNTSNGAANFYGLLNSGNAYTYVAGVTNQGSWELARNEAKNGTSGGSATGDSYLVTINSRLENFIASLAANYKSAWIGAWRPNTNSFAWTWADGPEAGQTFFTQSNPNGGTVTTGYYANFNPGEPNGGLNSNRSSTESAGQFTGTQGKWNDLPFNRTYLDAVLGFVRETNLAASPVTINAGNGAVMLQGGVGTTKALASLNVTAGSTTMNGNGLVTTGTQTYSGAVVLGANTTLTTTNSNVVFSSTINATTAGSQSLTIANGSGAVAFGGVVGGTAALSSVNVSSSTSTAILGGSVTTTGSQNYAGNMYVANSSAELNSTSGGVTIGGTISSGGVIQFTGTTTGTYIFNGASFTATSTPILVADVMVSFNGSTYTVVPLVANSNVQYLVVAGGGGGGGHGGGGGGAGGLLQGSALALNGGTTYTVTVGAGGMAGADSWGGNLQNNPSSLNGGNSSITGGTLTSATFTAIGGGGGGLGGGPGASGGSGGGGGQGVGAGCSSSPCSGGTGTAGQGNNGGAGQGGPNSYPSGGGGGAGGIGGSPSAGTSPGGAGGAGVSSSITGATYAAGGQGGYWGGSIAGASGANNTGNGGAGSVCVQNCSGAAGGSGIVVTSLAKYGLTINAGTGAVTVASANNVTGLTINSSSTSSSQTSTGVFNGAINVTIAGDGTFTLTSNNNNAYTGTITVNSGSTLAINPNRSGNVTFTGGIVNNGTVNFSNTTGGITPAFFVSNTSGAGAWNINSTISGTDLYTNRLIFLGSSTTTGPITVTNYGKFWTELSGSNSISYTSPIYLNGANTGFYLWGNGAMGVGTVTGTGNINFAGGGSAISLSVGNDNGTGTFGGVISNAAGQTLSLVKAGTGTQTLNGVNTYSGTTTINGGTLEISGAGQLGSGNYSAILTVASGANFNFASSANQTFSNSNLAGAGTINLNGIGVVTISGEGGTSTKPEDFSGTLNVSNQLTLNNFFNAYAGTPGLQGLNKLTLLEIKSGGTVTLAGIGSYSNFFGYNFGGNGNGSPTIQINAGGTLTTSADTSQTHHLPTLILAGGTLTSAASTNTSGYGLFNFDKTITVTADSSINVSPSQLTMSGDNVINVAAGKTLTVNGNTVLYGSGNLLLNQDNTCTGGCTGTLLLSTANTYSGGTTVAGGTLKAGNSTAFGTGAVTVNSGGVLDLNGTAIANNLTLNGTGINSGGALTNSNASAASVSGTVALASASSVGSNAGNITLSGVVSGANALTKVGLSTLTLSGANTYTGGTTISSGVLSVASGGASGSNLSSGTVTLSGGTLLDTATSTLGNAITLGAGSNTLAAATGVTATFSGVISGGNNVTVGAGTNNGTVVFSNANTYSGVTSIGLGTVRLANNNALGTGSAFVSGGAALDLNGMSISNNLTLNGTGISSGGALTNSSATAGSVNGTVALASASSVGGGSTGNITLSGIVSGANALTKVGSNTLTLSGANSYSGGTAISVGTLLVGNNGALGAGAATVNSGAALNLFGFAIANNLTLNGTGISSGGALTNSSTTMGSVSGTVALASASSVGGSAGNITLSGIVSGANALTKVGSNTLTLSGANTFSGGTTISVGTLLVGNSGALGTGAAMVNSGAALDLYGTSITNNLTLNGAGVNSAGALTNSSATMGSVSGTVALASASSVGGSAGNITLSGVVSGANALTKVGTNTLALSGINTYSGATTINSGTLEVTGTGKLGNGNYSATLTVASGANFNFASSANQTFSGTNLAGAGTINLYGPGAVTISGAGASTVTDFSGTLNVSNALSITGFYNGNGQQGLNRLTLLHIKNGGTVTLNGGNGFWNFFGYEFGVNGNGTPTIQIDTGGTLTTAADTYQTYHLPNLILAGGTLTSPTTSNTSGYGLFNFDKTITVTADSTINVPQSELTMIGGNVINIAAGKTLTVSGNTPFRSGSLKLNPDSSCTGGCTGTLVLSTANTYSATTITAGTLVAVSANSLGGNSATLTIASAGTLDLQNTATLSSLSMAGSARIINTSGSSALTVSGASTLSNSVTTTGTQTYNGAITLAGNTSLTAGLFAFSSASTSGAYGLSLLPYGASFTAAQSLSGMTLSSGASSLTSLTVGTSTNQRDVTLPSMDVAGPITVYGGAVTVNGSVRDTQSTANNGIQMFASGAFTLGSAGSLSTTNAKIVVTGSQIVNNNTSATAVSAGGSGNYWNIWSTNTNPFNTITNSADKPGSLAFDYKQYNVSYGGTVLGTGNGLLYSYAPVLSFALTGTVSKTYDGTTTATLAPGDFTLTGAVAGDVITPSTPTSGTLTSANVGTGLAVTASGAVSLTSASASTGKPVYGYQVANAGAATGNVGVISAKPLTIVLTANDKVYDTTNDATGTLTLSGTLANDSGTVTATSLTFASANVAYSGGNVTSQTVTASGLTLSGNLSNYTLASPTATSSAKITPAPLTVTATNQAGFVTLAPNLSSSGFVASGLLGGQSIASVNLSTTATQNSPASTYPLNIIGAVGASGTILGNYSVTYVPGTYTVAPAGSLLIASNGVSTVYGTNASVAPTSISYLAGGSTITTLTSSTVSTNAGVSTYTYVDGASGSISFNLAPTGTTISGSGNMNVGSYGLAANNLVTTSSNLAANAPLLVTGNYTVTPKSVAVTATTSTVIYNGALQTQTYTSGILSGDRVTVSGMAAGTNAGTYSSNLSATGTDWNNYNLGIHNANFTISPATLNVTGSNRTVTFNGSLQTNSLATVSGFVSGETGTVSGYAQGMNAGTYADNLTVTPSGSTSLTNYNILTSNGTLTINQANLTITGNLTGTVSKVYDGSNTATLSSANFTLTGWAGSDGATVTKTSGTYADKNAGSNKVVTVSLSASDYAATGGTNLSNYSLPTSISAAVGAITPASLSISGMTAANKTYDGTTAAVLSTASLVKSGLMANDVVNVSATGAFSDANAGNNKTVTLTSTYSGADVGNYTITGQPSTAANITPAALQVTANNASKTYNGQAYSGGNGVTYSGWVNGETVAVLGGSLSYGGSSQGAINAGTYAISPSGLSSNNYNITYTDGTLTVGQANLTITGNLTGTVSKVYDGSNTATLSSANFTLTGWAGSDGATVTKTSGTYADKNAGSNKLVTVSLSASNYAATGGTNLSNYILPTSISAAVGTITPAGLSISGITAANKTYDGNNAATVNTDAAVKTGLMAGDLVDVSATGTFSNPNAGNNKMVTLTSTYSGADVNNYTIADQTSTTANIDPKILSLVVPGASRTYNATTAISPSGPITLSGVMGLDNVTLSAGNVTGFVDKNVGTSKPVTYSGFSLGGTAAGNYSLPANATSTAEITKADLQVTGVMAVNKVYDTSTSGTLGGLPSATPLGSDVVTVNAASAAATFADKNVGTGKAVTVTGYTLMGTDAGNYNAVQPAGLTANITRADLPVTGVTATNKVYNANTTAVLNGTPAVTALGSDVVSVTGAGTATFANKNVGTAKPITVTGYTLTGTDAGNYNVVQPAGLTANITPADLQVTGVTAVNKVYNANINATLGGAALVTGLAGDDVVVAGNGTGTFANKNVGTAKAVTVSGFTLIGADAGNYNVLQPTGVTASITPADLQITGVLAASKVYNANATAILSGTATVAALASDVVTVNAASATGTFADKNVGAGKTVTVTGYTLSGADAGNYSALQPSGLTANITPADLQVTGVTVANKVYDGNTTATLNGTPAVASLGGDVVSVSATGTAAFGDKNVGTGKPVTVTGFSLTGTDAANYNILQPTGLSANITPATLTISGISAANKTYDGLLTAQVSTAGVVKSGLVAGDDVTVSSTGMFSDKDAGIGKTVNLTNSYGGADLGNYSIINQSTATANISPASLTMTAQNAAKLVGQADPAFTAIFSGFVNGETPAVLSGVSVTRTGTDSAANTYSGVLVPTASSSNYTITPVNGNFTIVPAETMLVTLANGSKAYGASVTGLTAISAQYLSSDNVLHSVTLTPGANGQYTYSDGLGTSGSFTVTTSASSTSGVGNYGITLSNFVKNGTNFTTQTSQDGNLVVNPLAVTLGAVSLSKVYDGNTSAQTSITVTNKVGADDVSVLGVGSYTDNKNAGHTHTYSLSTQLSGTSAVNYYLSSNSVTGSDGVITPAPLSIGGITAGTKVYDGTTVATLSMASVVKTGLIGGDQVTVNATGVFSDKNVGNGKAVNLTTSYGGADAGNYTIADQTSATANITPAALSISGITAANKTYDGTHAATVNTAAVVKAGLITGDVVNVSATGAFSNANAGNNKTVTLTSAYSGADVGNYTITDQPSTAANITPASLQVTANNASKTYNGQAYSGGNGVTYSGWVNGETVAVLGGSLSYSGSAQRAINAGTYAISPSGLSSNNYNITYTDGTLTIGQANLTITGNLTGTVSKGYDGSNAATLSSSNFVLTGWAGSDGATVTKTSGSYADKNAGSNKLVTVSLSASDYAATGSTNLSNYSLPTSISAALGTITPASLSISGITAANKTYDGTHAATVNTAAVVKSGLIAGDVVNVSATGAFSDPNVGNNKTVSLTSTYSGADVGNYTITGQPSTAANITPAALQVTANNASKTYNGQAFSGGNGVTYSGWVNGETVAVLGGSLSYSGSAQGAINAGTYAISPSGLSSNNYNITYTDGTLTIGQANLTITGNLTGTVSKVYDGSNAATLSSSNFVLTGWAGSDGATVTKTSGTYADKNAGINKVVTVSLSASDYAATGGTNLSNYSLPTSISAAVGSITPASLSISGITAANKTYDGTNAATVNTAAVVKSGLIAGDVVNVSAIGAFSDANAGNSKTVTLTSTYSGGDAGNYSIAGQALTAADIAPRALTITGSNNTVVANGLLQKNATSFTSTGLLGNDNVSSVFGQAAGILPGTYLDTLNGATGLGLGNYNISYINGSLEIKPAPTNVFANAASVLMQLVPATPQTTAPAKAVVLPGVRLSTLEPNQAVNSSNFVVKVEVPLALAQSKFEFKVPENAARYLGLSDSGTEPVASLVNQPGLPSWLIFDPKTWTFSAKDVPVGALPLTVEVKSGSLKITFQIDEVKN